MDDCHALRAAIEDLDEADRRAMVVAIARMRDDLVEDGEFRRAYFWGTLAAVIANVSDEQRKLFAELEDDATTPTGVTRIAIQLPGEQTGN